MRWPIRRNREPGSKRPTRMVAWALVLGFLYGLGGGIEYDENTLRVARNHINQQAVSGDIVLVGIDEKSLREVGRRQVPEAHGNAPPFPEQVLRGDAPDESECHPPMRIPMSAKDRS